MWYSDLSTTSHGIFLLEQSVIIVLAVKGMSAWSIGIGKFLPYLW
jgi:hypothetical protein